MVGELFEHVEALGGLAVGEVGGDLDPLGRLAGAVVEGAFEREIDEAGDLVAVADRDLARDQRRRAHRLRALPAAPWMLPRAWSILLTKMAWGTPSASSWRSIGSASRARAGSGSTTTIARSAALQRERAVGGEADRAGAVEQARSGRRENRNA